MNSFINSAKILLVFLSITNGDVQSTDTIPQIFQYDVPPLPENIFIIKNIDKVQRKMKPDEMLQRRFMSPEVEALKVSEKLNKVQRKMESEEILQRLISPEVEALKASEEMNKVQRRKEPEEVLLRRFISPEVKAVKVSEEIEESKENLLKDPSILEVLKKSYQLLAKLINGEDLTTISRRSETVSEGSAGKNSSVEEIFVYGENDPEKDVNDTELYLFKPPFMYAGINATTDNKDESKKPENGKTGPGAATESNDKKATAGPNDGRTSKGPKSGPQTTQPGENQTQDGRHKINYVLDRTNVTLLLKRDPFMQRLMEIRQKKKNNFINNYNYNKALYSGE